MWLTRPFPTHSEPIRDSSGGSRSFQPATVGGTVLRSPECTPAQTSRGIFYQSPWQRISSLPSPGGEKRRFIRFRNHDIFSTHVFPSQNWFFLDDYFPVRPQCFCFLYCSKNSDKKIIPVSKASSKCLRRTWGESLAKEESNVSRFLLQFFTLWYSFYSYSLFTFTALLCLFLCSSVLCLIF